ncbi:MAG: porin [Candidatus Eisenbacteria bacterium]
MRRFLFACFIALTVLTGLILSAQESRAQRLTSEAYPDSCAVDEELFNLTLAQLMEIDITEDRPGWFGTQLEQMEAEPYLHGYAAAVYRDFDLNRGRQVSTFDLHYFNVIAGVNIDDKIVAEVLLEYEHGGDDLGVRYGILDYKLAGLAILRFGKFLVPMGRFNEFLSTEYANKLPDRPLCLWNIVPIVWAESGVQVRGSYEFIHGRSINYSAYIVNGLEQSANADGSVADGGDIRKMRGNNRDSNHDNKARGGRIGLKPRQDTEISASYYTGAYTVDGKQNLDIWDLAFDCRRGDLTMRGEYVGGAQETSGDDLMKRGFYGEVAYRVSSNFEAVGRYGQVDLDDGSGRDIKRSTFGLIIYPPPANHPLSNFKISQSFAHDDGKGGHPHEFVIQYVIGF